MKEIPPRSLALKKRGGVGPKRIIHSPFFVLFYKSMCSHELAYPVRPFSRRESIVNCQDSTLAGDRDRAEISLFWGRRGRHHVSSVRITGF
jgi:hypothetical protein